MRTSGSRTTPRRPARNSVGGNRGAGLAAQPRRTSQQQNRFRVAPPAAMCAAAVRTSSVLLPVPGPPSTRTMPRAPAGISAVGGAVVCGADMSA